MIHHRKRGGGCPLGPTPNPPMRAEHCTKDRSTRITLFFLFSEEIPCWRTSSIFLANVFLLVPFKETSNIDVFLVEINVQTIFSYHKHISYA